MLDIFSTFSVLSCCCFLFLFVFIIAFIITVSTKPSIKKQGGTKKIERRDIEFEDATYRDK